MAKYAKAVVAGLVAGVVMFFTLRGDGVTAGEWETIVTAVLSGAGLTWAVPNETAQAPALAEDKAAQ